MNPQTPSSNGDLMAEGLACLRREQWELAAQAFARAARQHPDDPATWHNLAIALMRRERWDHAEQAVRRFLNLCPGDPMGLTRLGIILRQRGQAKESEDVLREALRAKQKLPVACKEMGVTLLALKRNQAARAAFRQALRLSPRYVEAWCGLGDAYEADNRIGTALEIYRQAILRVPVRRRGQLYARLGRLHLHREQWAEAREALEHAISHGAADTTVTLHLELACQQTGTGDKKTDHQTVFDAIGDELRQRLRDDLAEGTR